MKRTAPFIAATVIALGACGSSGNKAAPSQAPVAATAGEVNQFVSKI